MSEAREKGYAGLRDGGRLAYEIHGDRGDLLPLLLVRPLGGTMALWGLFRTRLADRLRVVSFDLRGTGQSSPDPAWVSTRGIARDAQQLLAHLGIARAHVFGISLGAMAATWLAALAPESIGKLCLASAPVRGVALSRAGATRGLSMASCFAHPERDVEAALVTRVLSHRFRDSHPDEVRAIVEKLHASPSSRTTLVKHALAGATHDASRALGRIRAETLVLVGEHDGLLGTEPSRALAQGLRGSELVVIPGAGHDLTLEQPALTAARVLSFVEAPERAR